LAALRCSAGSAAAARPSTASEFCDLSTLALGGALRPQRAHRRPRATMKAGWDRAGAGRAALNRQHTTFAALLPSCLKSARLP
jgi:hypothetical protein